MKWRKCAFFLASAVAIVALSAFAFYSGDPNRLLHAVDAQNVLCTDFAFYPKPTNTTAVLLCVSGCPLTSQSEVLCGDDPAYECFDSYPSKPLFQKYCLPAAYHQRQAVLALLLSTEETVSRIAGDVYRYSLLPQNLTSVFVTLVCFLALRLYFVPLQCTARIPMWTMFYLNLFSVIASMCFLSYSFYGDFTQSTICTAYENVEMERCEEPVSRWHFYTFLCLLGLFFLLLIRIGHHCKRKHTGLTALHQGMEGKVSSGVLLLTSGTLLIGMSVYYLCMLQTAFLMSCWTTRGMEDTYSGRIAQYEFSRICRTLVCVPVLFTCWCLCTLTNIVKIAAEESVSDSTFLYLLKSSLPKSIWLPHVPALRGLFQQSDPADGVLWTLEVGLVLLPPAVAAFVQQFTQSSSRLSAAVVLPLGFFLARLVRNMYEGLMRATKPSRIASEEAELT